MADWGLLGALRGRNSWSEIKAEKQRELQYQTVLNQMQSDENASLQQKQAAMQEYLNTANKLQVLPKGMERIRNIDAELRAPIAEKIKKYGGDLNKYFKVEGQMDMQNYLNSLLQNPTTVKEIMNASNAARWQADAQAGLQERYDIDEATGLPVNAFDKQLEEYNLGDRDVLTYKGGFKPGKTDETIYGKLYGDKNRYKSVPVTAGDYGNLVFQQLIDAGVNETDAKQQTAMKVAKYKSHLNNNGTPLRFKSDKWTPPSGWATAHDQDEAMKYTVEGVAGAMKPAKDNPEFGWELVEVVDPSKANKVQGTFNNVFGTQAGKPTTFYTSKRLAGTPLGKGAIPVFEMNADKTGVALDAGGKPIVLNQQQIDNSFEGFGQDEDGNVFYHTTVSDKLAELGQGEQWLPFTDSSIDALVLSAPAAQRPKLAASLRRALKEKGAYPKEQAPVFNSTVTVEYVDANGNDVDLTDATDEQIQSAIDGGIIKAKQ